MRAGVVTVGIHVETVAEHQPTVHLVKLALQRAEHGQAAVREPLAIGEGKVREGRAADLARAGAVREDAVDQA